MRRKKTAEKEVVRRRNTLRWRLTLFVFWILLVSGMLTALISVFMLAVFGKTPLMLALIVNPGFSMLTLLGICVLIGTVLSGFLGKYYLRPLRRLTNATQEVRQGNYKVQVEHSEGSAISEMDLLIKSFNEMVRELDGIELFRNDFINNFSHEFKTPIVSIRGFAKEMQMGDLSEEQKQEYAKIIAEEADRLAKLSISVLELSKLENQQIVTDKTEFYLDEQLRQCILLQESAWTEKGLEIIPELEEIRCWCNEEMLAHVWSNLISNAIKFTPSGGTVRVSLTTEGQWIRVEVSDTGVGMSPEVQAHIFEKFYQGDPSHHHRGYGIGLSMVDRVVRLCEGTVTVQSVPGQGSTFTVRLPLRMTV